MFGEQPARLATREVEDISKLLVVEDDPSMLQTLCSLLQLKGYDVASASDAASAAARLKDGEFELILLDLHLGESSGHEVMDFLREQGLDIPVIITSGDSSIDAAIESLRRGATDFIRKPYAPEELLKRVEKALHQRQLERDNADIREQLLRSEALYRYMVNSSPDVFYMLDESGRFTFLNEKSEALLGYQQDELVGQHYEVLVHPDDQELARHTFNERRSGERASRNIELRLRCRHDEDTPRYFEPAAVSVELSAMGVYSLDAGARRFHGTYGVVRDISDRKRAERTIKYQAYHDLLTGLPNRTLFEDHLSLALAQARRETRMLAVMFLDLDRFKVVNDTLGHVIGDRLLRVVSKRLKESLRSGDTLARIGGDEFLLLLPQLRSRAEAEAVARKIIDALRSAFVIDGYELYVGCSIGISIYPDDGDSRDSLIKHADIAMYHVKDEGKGNFQFYSGAMDTAFSRHLSMESDLRKAVHGEQFQVFFQPQVETGTGRICGLEALIRWNHPELGLLKPDEFIPLAEDTGLITSVGHALLRAVCGELKRWRDLGLPPVRVGVNLSALEVVQQRFAEMIIQSLGAHDLPGDLLEIEITENIIMRDLENVAQKLRQLSAHGIRIAIDDFGTGYSSLSYLKRLPIHTLKIDREFVQGISPSSRDDSSIVAAIVSLAKGLGLNLIAEGVETGFQRDYLQALGCESMQGFLFSEPVHPDSIVDVLRHGALQPTQVPN